MESGAAEVLLFYLPIPTLFRNYSLLSPQRFLLKHISPQYLFYNNLIPRIFIWSNDRRWYINMNNTIIYINRVYLCVCLCIYVYVYVLSNNHFNYEKIGCLDCKFSSVFRKKLLWYFYRMQCMWGKKVIENV